MVIGFFLVKEEDTSCHVILKVMKRVCFYANLINNFLQWSHHALTQQSSHYPSTNSYLPILIFTRINLSISPHRPAAYQLSQPESNDIIEMVMTLYNTQRVPVLILVVTLLEAEHLTALQMYCDSGKLHKNRLAWGERHSVHGLLLKVIYCIV